MAIIKRLPPGFLFIAGVTSIIFSAAIWCQWDNEKKFMKNAKFRRLIVLPAALTHYLAPKN